MPTQCYMIERTNMKRTWLRRYTTSQQSCPLEWGYHNAEVFWGEGEPEDDLDHSLWPVVCPCGHQFSQDDAYQVFTLDVWRRPDTGELGVNHMSHDQSFGPGAMWYADWLEGITDWLGPDDKSLWVRLPDGTDWGIDTRANNCTMPDDHVRKCWVRHGEPPLVTVDKNGLTCAAGAGSVGTTGWHGFLRHGVLVE